ncbi:MAG: cell envelope integrity protein CreD [Betaproteobacteria bacterium]|nr:cell envelope integrity protein CreD [Betaproteobacteria bacterium]
MNRAAFLKTSMIGALALLLLIPVAMIRDLIHERQARRNQAVGEIALGWGGRQAFAGPYLVVPYERFWTEVEREVVDGIRKERRTERSRSSLLRLPVDTMDWSIGAATGEKVRGIYRARLYTATIRAQGRITLAARFGMPDSASRYRWGTPRFVVGVSDPRGIRSLSALAFGNQKFDFAPGPGDSLFGSGMHAALSGLAASESRTVAFSFSIELAGSEALAVAPLARNTIVALRSDWPHPSFQGVFLPVQHEATRDGFVARWQVSSFAAQGAERLKACEGGRECAALTAQELGVSFIEPVSVYQQLERASKYGFLFIGLMFSAFFLFELLRRLAIHPIQYLLVGLALAMFFLLLTALSEHVTFGIAYAIATLACVGLVTTYFVRALRNKAAGLTFGGALALLYGALYMLLKAEDYALLAGAGLLFALLAGVMIATRRVDWYRLAPLVPGEGGAAAGAAAGAVPHG